jgi:hypothetical protein
MLPSRANGGQEGRQKQLHPAMEIRIGEPAGQHADHYALGSLAIHKPHGLVAASATPLTHKMVPRACKGRRLTLNTQSKVLAALNRAAGQNYALGELFDY